MKLCLHLKLETTIKTQTTEATLAIVFTTVPASNKN
jgi:hypothetical protein